MLRFHADKFVNLFNALTLLEALLEKPETLLQKEDTRTYIEEQVRGLERLLRDLNLFFSAKEAFRVYIGLSKARRDDPAAWSSHIKRRSEELRQRVVDELEGKAFYYVSDHVDLLSDLPLFGEQVDEAFPSARHDITEAGRCLALRRSTACVLHLMRALEPGLASLAAALGVDHADAYWQNIIDRIEKEIRSRNKGTHGKKWKDEDEPFFSEAATHFRMIKNAWRNHAMHAKDKYTDEEAEKIYESVRSFMHHLSARLSEEEQSS